MLRYIVSIKKLHELNIYLITLYRELLLDHFVELNENLCVFLLRDHGKIIFLKVFMIPVPTHKTLVLVSLEYSRAFTAHISYFRVFNIVHCFIYFVPM